MENVIDSNGVAIEDSSATNEKEKVYIGTKVVKGEAMTEEQFLVLYKNGEKKEYPVTHHFKNGYKVTYEDGYISWSPEDVFERCYREVSKQELEFINK